MTSESERVRLQGLVAELLFEYAADRLSGHGLRGLTWSPRMPDDDPNADFLVVDREGVEYVLEIDVTLWRPQTVETIDTHQLL